MKRLSERLREIRKSKKLTLDQLAQSVGSSKSYIWQLESDSKIKPSVELVAKIAKALDVTVDFLISDEMDKMNEDQEAMVFFRGYKDLSEDSKELINLQIEKLKKMQHNK